MLELANGMQRQTEDKGAADARDRDGRLGKVRLGQRMSEQGGESQAGSGGKIAVRDLSHSPLTRGTCTLKDESYKTRPSLLLTRDEQGRLWGLRPQAVLCSRGTVRGVRSRSPCPRLCKSAAGPKAGAARTVPQPAREGEGGVSQSQSHCQSLSGGARRSLPWAAIPRWSQGGPPGQATGRSPG